MMQNNFGKQIEGIIDLFVGKSSFSAEQEKAAELEFDRLTIAAQAENTELFQQLLIAEQANKSNENKPTLLMSAVMAKRVAVVEALLKAGADVTATYEQFFVFDALGCAVDDGSTEIVRLLLAGGQIPIGTTIAPDSHQLLQPAPKVIPIYCECYSMLELR